MYRGYLIVGLYTCSYPCKYDLPHESVIPAGYSIERCNGHISRMPLSVDELHETVSTGGTLAPSLTFGLR